MSTVERGSFLYVETQIVSDLYCPKCKKNVPLMSGAGIFYIRYYCRHCKAMLAQVQENI